MSNLAHKGAHIVAEATPIGAPRRACERTARISGSRHARVRDDTHADRARRANHTLHAHPVPKQQGAYRAAIRRNAGLGGSCHGRGCADLGPIEDRAKRARVLPRRRRSHSTVQAIMFLDDAVQLFLRDAPHAPPGRCKRAPLSMRVTCPAMSSSLDLNRPAQPGDIVCAQIL